MGYRVDKFSFTRRTQDLPINRLFLRDNFGLWYQRGLQGVSKDAETTANYLKGFIAKGSYDRVSCLGISAGGYAALLFGAMLDADVVHSISPRSLLHPDAEAFSDRNRHGVNVSLQELKELPESTQKFFDLADFLNTSPTGAQTRVVHFDPANELDRFHALRLAGCPAVTFKKHTGGGHALGKLVVQLPSVVSDLLG
ncbi:MAG: hypothetical protein AAGI03_01030 [Pseudomonadota bacterium]